MKRKAILFLLSAIFLCQSGCFAKGASIFAEGSSLYQQKDEVIYQCPEGLLEDTRKTLKKFINECSGVNENANQPRV